LHASQQIALVANGTRLIFGQNLTEAQSHRIMSQIESTSEFCFSGASPAP
jgi:hypothetical protein